MTETNSVRPRPDKADALALAQNRMTETNSVRPRPDKADALALAQNRMTETNSVRRMGARQPRVLSSVMKDGNVVHIMSDGTARVEKLRVAHTARVSASAKKKEVQEPEGKSTAFLLGFAAGVAAMGGAVASKKAKG